MRVEQDQLVITADRPPRHGWKGAFASAGSSGCDELLLALPSIEFDAGGGLGEPSPKG